MKQLTKPQSLPWLTLIVGAAGLVLRFWLYTTADGLGFVARWHISAILLYVLTAAILVLLFIGTRALTQANKYPFNFPASAFGGIGTLAAAAAIAVTSILELFTVEDIVSGLTVALGFFSAVALIFLAHARWKGLHPSTLFHIVICGYLMLRLFHMYRSWSSDPQLQDFCFQCLAMVCAMLATYHRATFDANFGQRHSYVFFSLAAVYFCFLSLTGPDHILFFLGVGLWRISDLCNLTPMPKGLREKDA